MVCFHSILRNSRAFPYDLELRKLEHAVPVNKIGCHDHLEPLGRKKKTFDAYSRETGFPDFLDYGGPSMETGVSLWPHWDSQPQISG
jgi:hypothetical protein